MLDTISLEYLSPFEFANLKSHGRKILVVDVRDEDRSVGWIPESFHLPSETLNWSVMEAFLIKHWHELSDSYIVFHCMYSKQRGPAAARLCLEVLESVVKPTESVNNLWRTSNQVTQVFILRGGFIGFQKAFPEKVIY